MDIKKKNRWVLIIVKAAVLIGILWLVLVCLSILVRPKDNTKSSGTINYEAKAIFSEPKDTIDVVAIGASNYWCGYTPMQVWENTGISSYNCGTLMQEIWYSYYFLEEIFEAQSPKIVLFDADVLFLEGSSQLDNVNSMITTALNWKLPVMEYHNRFKSLTKDDFTLKVENTFHNYKKGYYHQNAQQSYEVPEDYMNQKFQNETITGLTKMYLDKIKKLCEENGAELVLLEAPAIRAWNHKRNEEVIAYAKERNLEFVDANMYDLKIDWTTDSRDGGFHLNTTGAKKFTAFVEDYLKEQGLKDHRGEDAYSMWEEDLEKYREEIK